MGRGGGAVIILVVVALAAVAASVWAWHIRSWPEARDVALSLQRLTLPGYTGIFRAGNGPPLTSHATEYVVEILEADDTVETRTLSLPGTEGFSHDLFAPGEIKIYAQRVRGQISIGVEPDSYGLREDSFDHVGHYGAVINPAKLPKNYIATLRDHAVAWHLAGEGYHSRERHAEYLNALTGCLQTPYSAPDDSIEAKLLIQGEPDPEGYLPEFAVGRQTFYITQPDSRACVHGGHGDNWNACEHVPAFGRPNSAYSSGRCPAMAVPLLDSCALVGELLLCNLEDVVAVRVRRKVPLENADNAPIYLIAAPYLDGGVVLPRNDKAAYEKVLDTLTPLRIKRALDVQEKMTRVPLNGG